MDALTLTNMIRQEVECVNNHVPLDALPDKVQQILLDLAHYENFSPDYAAMAMLSAVASAIGNACHIRIKGSWTSSSCLYMVLVGRPGQGKTSPLDFAYKPIQEQDYQNYCKFKDDFERYNELMGEKGKKGEDDNSMKKPILKQTILSDFTQEAMIRHHSNNLRGITIFVDEIMGMFNSINRYGDSPLESQLLTAYSGKQLKMNRCNSPVPYLIRTPCINIVGSTQTQRIGELFTKERIASGLIDRIMFVYPKEKKPSVWLLDKPDTDISTLSEKRWKVIMDKILDLPMVIDESQSSISPLILNMSDDGRAYFYNWRNRLCETAYSTCDNAIQESRIMKMDSHVARLAVIIQVLRWACGESHMQFVDIDSIKSAIRIHEYLEESYSRVADIVAETGMDPLRKEFIDLLGNTFTTADAITAGREVGMSESGVKKSLPRMVRDKLLRKVKHGIYEKVLQNASANLGTFGTSTLSKAEESAKVPIV